MSKVEKKIKKVYISYSWDSDEHKEWVRNLTNKLIANGIDTLLDQYNLQPGQSSTQFMELSIEQSDKVIVVLTPNYIKKSSERKGGVGYEQQIITGEIMGGQDRQKFIPILRSGSKDIGEECAIPPHFSGIIYIDFRYDKDYESSLDTLIRDIYNRPKLTKPPLGNPPDFTNVDHRQNEKFIIKLDKYFHATQSEVVLEDIFVSIADIRKQNKQCTIDYQIELISDKLNQYKSFLKQKNMPDNKLRQKLKLKEELDYLFYFANNATLYDYLDTVIYSIIDYYYNAANVKPIKTSSELVAAITNCFTLFSIKPIQFVEPKGQIFALINRKIDCQIKLWVSQNDIDYWFTRWRTPYNESALRNPGKDVSDLSDFHDRIINEFIPKQVYLFITEHYGKNKDETFKKEFFCLYKWKLESRADYHVNNYPIINYDRIITNKDIEI